MRSIAHRKADRVLPEPVGATTTVWWPELIASHAPACAVVGALKLLRNHSAVAGEKRSSTSARLPFAIEVSLPSRTDIPQPAQAGRDPRGVSTWSRSVPVVEDEHRTVRVLRARRADRAEQEPGEAAVPTAADDEERGAPAGVDEDGASRTVDHVCFEPGGSVVTEHLVERLRQDGVGVDVGAPVDVHGGVEARRYSHAVMAWI